MTVYALDCKPKAVCLSGLLAVKWHDYLAARRRRVVSMLCHYWSPSARGSESKPADERKHWSSQFGGHP